MSPTLMQRFVDVAAAPLTVSSRAEVADAIVVLGAPLTADAELTDVLWERVGAGVQLWRRGLASVVCFSGGGPVGRVEAEAMAKAAIGQGLDPEAVLIETRSRTTRQNAECISEMLRPGARIWVVTQPFHLRRTAAEMRRAGLRPLCWHITESMQYRQTRRAARWVAREYLAFFRRSALLVLGR